MKPSMIVAAIFLFIVSLSHLLRVIYQMQLIVGGTEIPMWPSVVACVFTAALATWLLADNRRRAF